jgi:hypothetical protein
MSFKLFRKPSDLRPRIEQHSSLAEELFLRRCFAPATQKHEGFIKR